MALQGNIDSFSVVDVLRLLGQSQKTGRLVVDGDRGSGSLWLVDGLVVAGVTARAGGVELGAPPAEVLFDLLRFREGSFVFEGGETFSGRDDHDTIATEVEPLVAEAEVALVEWDEITAVVPSTRSALALAPVLGATSVTLDERLWSAVVAVATEGSAPAGPACVDTVAARLGLSELPTIRLARDLVVAGVLEVGPEVVAPAMSATVAGPLTEPFDPAFHPPSDVAAPELPASGFAPFEPAAFDAGVVVDPVTWEPIAAPAPHSPPAYDATHQPFAEPFVEPFAATGVETGAEPAADAVGFDAFARFDPFGTADAAPEPSPAGVDPSVGEEPSADAVDEEALQADLARQLAMLSPRAAEAVASADAGPSSEDEERARVARFLGSV